MLRRSCRCLICFIGLVLIVCLMDGVASDCIPDLVYMCEVPRITATVHQVAVVAPGRPPSCAPEAGSCFTVITARKGERIAVTGNTGISISPCNDHSYVQFSDGSHTSPRHCQVSPPTAPTTTDTTGVAPLYMSKTNSMTVTYGSSGSESFMSIYIRALGCAHDDLIEGNNIQVSDEAFNRNGYSVNVTCEPGYLLSNTSTSASASCTWNPATQTLSWSINRKFECRDDYYGAPPQQVPPNPGENNSVTTQGAYMIIGASIGGGVALIIIAAVVAVVVVKRQQARNKGSRKAVITAPSTQSENIVTAEYVNMSRIVTNQRIPPSSSPSGDFRHSSPYEEITTALPSSLLFMDHAGTQNPLHDCTGNYVNLTSGSQNPLTDQPQYESLKANTNDLVYTSLEVH